MSDRYILSKSFPDILQIEDQFLRNFLITHEDGKELNFRMLQNHLSTPCFQIFRYPEKGIPITQIQTREGQISISKFASRYFTHPKAGISVKGRQVSNLWNRIFFGIRKECPDEFKIPYKTLGFFDSTENSNDIPLEIIEQLNDKLVNAFTTINWENKKWRIIRLFSRANDKLISCETRPIMKIKKIDESWTITLVPHDAIALPWHYEQW